jgi:hypothetical protein
MGARFWFGRGTRVNLRINFENFRELKKLRRFRFDEVRQRFRLTPTEKRVAAFVLAAFVLGLATKCYRDTHLQQAVLINKDHARVKKAQH